MILCLNLSQIFKKSDKLILDMGCGVLSHRWPIWPVYTYSGADQEYESLPIMIL